MSYLESGDSPVTFRQSKKVILATVVGNGLVIYDFTVLRVLLKNHRPQLLLYCWGS